MSPVAICPVHGVFETPWFGMQNGSVTFVNSQEMCRVPGCGRWSRIVDGTFSIENSLATIVSAPEWSREAFNAVRSDLLAMAEALESNSYTDERAYKLLETRLARMEQRAEVAQSQQQDLVIALTEEVRSLSKKQPRTTFSKTLRAIWSVVGVLAQLTGGILGTVELIEWVQSVIHSGSLVSIEDLPAEVLAPAQDNPSK